MKELSLQELLDRILRAEPEELDPIIVAVTERFTQVWPEWELMTISIPGHTAEAHINALNKALQYVHSLGRLEK